MRCFRKLLGISYRDHITNDAVRDRIRQAIGPYDDILTTVKKCKLKWFGCVSRSSGLAKTILQGTVQGGRRRGRQKKRWENNIAEWTGLKFCNAVREAENKLNGGRGLQHPWCPNGHSLFDRCRCIMVSDPARAKLSGILEVTISDHFLVFIDINLKSPK